MPPVANHGPEMAVSYLADTPEATARYRTGTSGVTATYFADTSFT